MNEDLIQELLRGYSLFIEGEGKVQEFQRDIMRITQSSMSRKQGRMRNGRKTDPLSAAEMIFWPGRTIKIDTFKRQYRSKKCRA
jgi:hypothetical protein